MISVAARAATRSRIITDLAVSSGGLRLYLWLDEISKGRYFVRVPQLRASQALGVSQRQIQNRFSELVKTGYITVRRTQTGNIYHFDGASQ